MDSARGADGDGEMADVASGRPAIKFHTDHFVDAFS